MTDTPFLERPSIAPLVEQLTKAIESEAEAQGDKFKTLLVTVETAEKSAGVVIGCTCPICMHALLRGAGGTIANALVAEAEVVVTSGRVH